MEKKTHVFQVGDSVMVKSGTKDPDTGGDLSDWQGRITEVDDSDGETIVTIEWDSITLKNTPLSIIKDCEREGLDWRVIGLSANDVQPVVSRDTKRDVEKLTAEIERQVSWAYLDDESERIQQVLSEIDADDEIALMEAWEEHLEENLKFPFEAKVAESQDRGRLRTGDRVEVKSISLADEMYGVIVHVQRGKEPFDVPLCDLEATDKTSENCHVLRAYVVWFANR
ncbi:MAG: hypothetical protein JNK38_25160 [Acidobacteria bacterium]|nr:hypothetical protein [Acidobacteriota bacterium]